MTAKYCSEGLQTPLKDVIYRDPGAAYEGPFCARIKALTKTYKAYFEDLDQVDPCIAMMQPIEMAVQCNKFIEVKAPWKIAKVGGTQNNDVLYTLAESLRIIAILISPVLPKAAHGIFGGARAASPQLTEACGQHSGVFMEQLKTSLGKLPRLTGWQPVLPRT